MKMAKAKRVAATDVEPRTVREVLELVAAVEAGNQPNREARKSIAGFIEGAKDGVFRQCYTVDFNYGSDYDLIPNDLARDLAKGYVKKNQDPLDSKYSIAMIEVKPGEWRRQLVANKRILSEKDVEKMGRTHMIQR